MDFQNYLDAINTVLTWDIPEGGFADAVIAQAGLMAGISPDEITGFYS